MMKKAMVFVLVGLVFVLTGCGPSGQVPVEQDKVVGQPKETFEDLQKALKKSQDKLQLMPVPGEEKAK